MEALNEPRAMPGKRAPQIQKRHDITSVYRSLMAAAIDRAMSDLKGIGPKCRAIETDRAMAFVLSDDCETWCLELGIDCEALRRRAAALYRRFQEAEDRGESPCRRRKSNKGGRCRSL